MDPRRALPGIDVILASPAFGPLLAEAPRELLVAALRVVQERLRATLTARSAPPAEITDPAWYAAEARAELARWRAPSLVPVLNATGVVLHTNLGRAPLAPAALAAVAEAGAGYCSLEYDLEQGRRGSRYAHCVALLTRLTGAADALVVNNNAAALVLALNTLALGREAVISRGELVEIGGEFRVSEIMGRSGAGLREVGATNRTHASDYRSAIGPATALLVKVHRSNFRQTGFVAEVSVAELAALAHEHDLPLLYDLGSGLLSPPHRLGLPADEPGLVAAVAAGADLVAASGDKLLGGPQAGILLGRSDLLAACRANPLCRAFRVDKLTLAALSATLALYLDPRQAESQLPVLAMLQAPLAELEERATRVAAALRSHGVEASTGPAESRAGGGTLPDFSLPTCVVRLLHPAGATALEQRLRAGRPPVVARISAAEVLLDLRTVPPTSESALVQAVLAAWLP
jgi:L-seryl-tRNA(Ser) seleniumtransferase